MTFWTYMLQCSDRLFYVGHTDDLERRFGEHQAGTVPGYSKTRRPVHLVWSAEFPSRDEARRVERQLEGWGRLKKLALIRGDWDAISALAKGGQKEGASASSANPVGWRNLGSLFLHPHPASLSSEPFSLEGQVKVFASGLQLRYRLTGPLDQLDIPPCKTGEHIDGLWQHTCFELFAAIDANHYLEFNFSPSTDWAAYRFSAYRSPVDWQAEPPRIATSRTKHTLHLTATLTLPPGITPTRIGLSAVIKEISGRKSYWALAHPPGDKPDFHHPDCFALELPPAGEP